MKKLVTPAEALHMIEDEVAPLAEELVSFEAAIHRTLSRPVVSPVDLPPFDNSAMDGYAVRARDLAGTTPEWTRRLPVGGIVAAGAVPAQLPEGHCARIMTGAAIPPGADAIVMREDTDELKTSTVFKTSPKAGSFIRTCGSDIGRGETGLPAGALVRSAEWSLLASLEQSEVWVGQKPRVRLIITGDEVTPIGQELEAGAIRDSNSWTLRALASACGAEVAVVRVGDDAEEFKASLSGDCDAIITSGGISMGDYDIVRDVLPTMADIHFYKVAMKPGKPVMFGTLHGDRTPVFALPGNPVSVMVSFELFVRPALLKMQYRYARRRPVVDAVLETPLSSPEDKVEWARALLTQDLQGAATVWSARVDGDQGSGRLSTMTRANALLEIPLGVARLEAGETVRAHLTDCAEIQ